MNVTQVNNTPATDWLTPTQVARMLGCHRNTARTMAKRGVFPNAIKLLRDYRVPRGDVDSYIDQQRTGGNR